MVRAGLLVAIVGGLSACGFQSGVSRSDAGVDAPPDSRPDSSIDASTIPFWTAVVGATATGNHLVATAANGWGNAGAVSIDTVTSGDCYVEFTTLENNLAKALGLSSGNSTQHYKDIDFDLRLDADGTFSVFEGTTLRGQIGPYAANDVFRLEVISNVVRFLRNGQLVYTSALTPTYPLLVDSAFYHQSATLSGVNFVDQ